MSIRMLSTAGIVAAGFCLWLAAVQFPGGFDWNRDFISTLLRGPVGPSRWLAEAGVVLFCISIALLFERLARTAEFAKRASIVRISGLGSQVYACLTITPLHDLMVTISFGFLLVAVPALTIVLYGLRSRVLFVLGCVAFVTLGGSAFVYYSGQLMPVLPWLQRLWLVFFAMWMLLIAFKFPARESSEEILST